MILSSLELSRGVGNPMGRGVDGLVPVLQPEETGCSSRGTGTATSAPHPSVEARTKPELQLSHCQHGRTGLIRFVRGKCFVMKLYFYSAR